MPKLIIAGKKYLWTSCIGAFLALVGLGMTVFCLLNRTNTLEDSTRQLIMLIISSGVAIVGVIITAIGLFYYFKFGRHNKKPKIPIIAILVPITIVFMFLWVVFM